MEITVQGESSAKESVLPWMMKARDMKSMAPLAVLLHMGCTKSNL